MKFTNTVLVSVLVLLLAHSSLCAMTIEIGSGAIQFVEPNDTWQFFRGTEPPSDPPNAWKEIDFNDSLWETGQSGFGYGDGDDNTILSDMEDNYLTVYIRKEFVVSSVPPQATIQLVIDYDDGFVAYLNGDEVKWLHMPEGEPNYTTQANPHEAGTPEIIPLGTAGELLDEGINLLAIEGHNTEIGSSDFSLIPALRTAPETIQNGDTWIVDTQTVTLSGGTEAGNAVCVVVDGNIADFNPGDGTWSCDVSLAPGLNTITAQALNANADIVDSGSIEVVYVPPANHISGELTENTTWSGACVLEDTVVVGAGAVLTIEPGTWVLMKDDVAIIVFGRLIADGTEAEPIHLTHYGDGTTWKQIMFIEAADSRLAHCIIEYADSEGKHQDYYEPGPRDYHEAIVALACRVDIESCTFQRLPDDGSEAEGDAIAIISDDPNYPGDAAANIKSCQFLSIGQGVHTRYAYVLVEDCFFTGKRGDNDDVDLWGESTPPPLIQNNIFLNPGHDDMINPTKCSAVIIGNLIAGSDDHGVVLRDRCFPVMINNLIYDCSSAGIAVENSCEALLINNTIVDCGKGIRLFELTGRFGPPYNLSYGGGIATVINCIIWDCPDPITLNDSSNTEIDDPGSHATVKYCDIEGGRDAIPISGTYSTLTWGAGNIDIDPQFAQPGSGDFHLRSQAGRWDSDSESWVEDGVTSTCIDAGDPNSDWTSELWPHGKLINTGAYGGTAQARMSLSTTGIIADLNNDNLVDHNDTKLFTEKWLRRQNLLAEDLNRNGFVDSFDFALMALHWLRDADR